MRPTAPQGPRPCSLPLSLQAGLGETHAHSFLLSSSRPPFASASHFECWIFLSPTACRVSFRAEVVTVREEDGGLCGGVAWCGGRSAQQAQRQRAGRRWQRRRRRWSSQRGGGGTAAAPTSSSGGRQLQPPLLPHLQGPASGERRARKLPEGPEVAELDQVIFLAA